jgi:hypothetical protein
MSEKKSLQKIIEDVLKENKMPTDDSNVRGLRRSFERFLTNIGGEKEILKEGGRIIEFDVAEVPFMKAILRQLYNRQGLVWKMAEEQTEKSVCSTAEVYELIESIIDVERNKGANETESEAMAEFFSKIFLFSQLRYLENCHKIIDLLILNLQDLTSTRQAVYLGKVEHILKKEFALRIAESTIEIHQIADIIEQSKQFIEDEIHIQAYSEHDPEIRLDYIQRDKNVLDKIKEDEDLRIYIEKKVGKKAEDIFNYAALGDKV